MCSGNGECVWPLSLPVAHGHAHRRTNGGEHEQRARKLRIRFVQFFLRDKNLFSALERQIRERGKQKKTLWKGMIILVFLRLIWKIMLGAVWAERRKVWLTILIHTTNAVKWMISPNKMNHFQCVNLISSLAFPRRWRTRRKSSIPSWRRKGMRKATTSMSEWFHSQRLADAKKENNHAVA